MTRPALIQCDAGLSRMRRCMVQDVSETGGQLLLADTAALPLEFTLVLSYGGGVKRRCQVAWQDGNKVGVRFTARQSVTAPAAAGFPPPAGDETPKP